MVVPQEMQEPVHQQAVDLARRGLARCPRLALCNRDANNDVPQESLTDACGPFRLHGKGQDVSGPVLASIPAIERSHGAVADEQDAENYSAADHELLVLDGCGRLVGPSSDDG